MGAVTAKVPFSGREVPHGTIPADEGFAVDSTDSEERGILSLISSLRSLWAIKLRYYNEDRGRNIRSALIYRVKSLSLVMKSLISWRSATPPVAPEMTIRSEDMSKIQGRLVKCLPFVLPFMLSRLSSVAQSGDFAMEPLAVAIRML
jgi:hypothetical protein